MKVELLKNTPKPSLFPIYVAAKRCVTENIETSFDDSREQQIRVVDSCIAQGHLSVFEFTNLVFNIEGITRSCSHQLVRHRHFSFCQMSQRRVQIGTREEYNTVKDWYDGNEAKGKESVEIILNHFYCKNPKIFSHCAASFLDYWEMIDEGVAEEDARDVLPECTLTNIVVGCNMRALIEASQLRLCAKAQNEIHSVFKLMKLEVLNSGEDGRILSTYLLPKCLPSGICNERQSCGYFKGFENGELKRKGSKGRKGTCEKTS